MWEQTKTELDSLFLSGNKISVERRGSNRWKHFTNHLDYLQSFAALQRDVIRPVMSHFGRYAESLGHQHYIESAEELVEGYLLPTSRVSLHILMNVYPDPGHPVSHAVTFKTDGSRHIYLYRRHDGQGAEKSSSYTSYRHAVGRYDLCQITPELVKAHLKDFLADALLPQQQKAPKLPGPHWDQEGKGSYHDRSERRGVSV